MKSFKTYLTESHRTYDFRIRLAGELPKNFNNRLKTVLEAYNLISTENVKRLPIQESPLFPNAGPVEVNVVDVKLQYPCTDDQLIGLIAEQLNIHQSCLRITPVNSPFELALEGKEKSNLSGDVVLSKDEMVAEKPDKDLVGDARIPSLIKELEETRKYEYSIPAGGKSPEGKTTNSVPLGNMSPIGSRQNKIPSPVKGN
jgi:hypothetical protein